ncbi:hypothetical protein R1sor_012690 [Riccia sorocarpa]|uniref:Reverse transcriptase Ty1/copia-type domain-containing protein n=1 Tax=Riccia sorocarpa TaxID=122646 RepID=A0ABD3IAP2_9MARC
MPARTVPLKRGRGRPLKETNPLAVSQSKRQRGRPSELVPLVKQTCDDTQIIGESSKVVPSKSVPTEVDVPLMRQEPSDIRIPDLNYPAHTDDEQLKDTANEKIVLCMCADEYVICKPDGSMVWKREQVKLDTQFAMAVAESIQDQEEPMSIAECKTLEINPCIFFHRQGSDFIIITIYVNDLNLIGTQRGIDNDKSCLSSTFEMKELGPVTFYLGLQLSRVAGGILVHQTRYLQKVLTKFSMIDCHPRDTPLEVRNLKPEQDIYGPMREGETILLAKYPYLAAIGSLMYAAMTTRPDIAFSVNLLARHTQDPTQRHWNVIKQIIRYLHGIMDVRLFYVPHEDSTMRGYADARNLTDMTTGRSQTGFVFLNNGAAISVT